MKKYLYKLKKNITNIKAWYNYFIYISLVFVAIALYKSDYFKIPKIESQFFIFSSLLIYLFGFIFEAISWKQILNKTGIKISLSESLASIGLSIFGIYMPGKIWLLVGKTAYISKYHKNKKVIISAQSLNAQIISLWAGLILGTFGLLINEGLAIYGLIVLILLIILTLIVFTNFFHRLIQLFFYRIIKKKFNYPKLSIKEIVGISPWFFLSWLFYSFGFFVLIKGLYDGNLTFDLLFAYAFACSLSILVIFTPGGIGIREGLLVGYLLLSGFNIQIATTISLTSRLWGLVGEVFIFIVGFISDKIHKNKINYENVKNK